jgi:hypothetical protein
LECNTNAINKSGKILPKNKFVHPRHYEKGEKKRCNISIQEREREREKERERGERRAKERERRERRAREREIKRERKREREKRYGHSEIHDASLCR